MGGGGSAAVSPLTIFGAGSVAVWLPNGSAAITIATGVSRWADSSGNGHDVVQATGADQPAFSASGGPNGKSIVNFTDNGPTFLALATLTLPLPFEYFVVFVLGATTNTNNYMIDMGVNNDYAVANAPNISVVPTATFFGVTTGVPHVVNSILNGSASTAILDNVTTSGSGVAASATALTVGSYGGHLATNAFGGGVCEVVVINRASTAPERAAFRSYVGAEYNF